jgi:hypothetical protein
MPNPAGNIVRSNRLVDRLRSLNAFWQAHLQGAIERSSSYLDIKGVDLVHATVDRINSRFREEGWEPTRLDLGEDIHRAVAAYRSYDVSLVRSATTAGWVPSH